MRIFLTISFLFLSSFYSLYSISIFSQNPHPSVQSSLIRGLNTLGVPFNLNPCDADVHDVALVLDGIDWLRHLIHLKNSNRVTCLLAGPNLMNRACDFERILANPALDVFLAPSKWVEIAYIEDEPLLVERIAIWYVGVDSNWWQPSADRDKSLVLVYWKTDSEEFCLQVEDLLRSRGYNPVRIQYGHYIREHYKNVLDCCEFAVFISRSESQGIALAEAWAMNVPTFVWNPQQLSYAGKQYNPVSACPYLTDQQGKEWLTIDQLDQLIQAYQNGVFSYNPREWICEYMTDEASARLLLKIIDDVQKKNNNAKS